MGIRTTLDSVASKLQSLSVDAGTFDWHSEVININTVYKYGAPDESETVDAPCWILSWSLNPVIRGSGVVESIYDIRMQLAVYDSDQNRASEIAAAFMDELLTSFNADPTLGGEVQHHDLQGSSPTLVQLELDKKYIGIDVVCTVYIKDFN